MNQNVTHWTAGIQDNSLLDLLSGYVCIQLAGSRALHVATVIAEVSKMALTSFLTLLYYANVSRPSTETESDQAVIFSGPLYLVFSLK